MIHLIGNNKGGRNFDDISQGIHWKSFFKTSEDSLTSSVFGLLFYLPVELLWSILRSSGYSDELPKTCGPMLGYEFWPRWENEKETHTEPDIFVQFEEFDLIIEAKRYDYNQQYENQWRSQVDSYYVSFSTTSKKLYMIAIGGIRRGEENSTVITALDVQKDTIVIKSRWRKLLTEVIKVQKELIKNRNLLNATGAVVNIVNDLILSFRIHGFVTADLFNTLPTSYDIRTNTKAIHELPPLNCENKELNN